MTLDPQWAGLPQLQFGDSPELADRLAALVVAGVKTATCSAAIHGPDAKVGDRQVCQDGRGNPVCVIETVSLTKLLFEDVTPEMASLEGEGDLSYRFWRDAHIAFFKREGTWSSNMQVHFEIFRCVAVLDQALADAAPQALLAERREAYETGYTAIGPNGETD